MAGLWSEFKQFIARGNVLDLAVGIIIGAAFNGIVNSLVNDVIMPPIGYILGQIDFSNLYISLSGASYASLAEAQAAGAATINYGLFINSVINFLIVAFVVFLIVRQYNRMLRAPKAPEAKPEIQQCPYCLSDIPAKATRCRECAADLPAKS